MGKHGPKPPTDNPKPSPTPQPGASDGKSDVSSPGSGKRKKPSGT